MMTISFRRLNIKYSLKNIPNVSKFRYQKMMVMRTEQLLKRMRWKVYWFRNKKKGNKKNTYGFNSTKHPKAMKELKAFEDDLIKMIGDIEMRRNENNLQKKMREDISLIKGLNGVIVSADKTDNLYVISKEDYLTQLHNSITEDYRKDNDSTLQKIDQEAAVIASDLEIVHF